MTLHVYHTLANLVDPKHLKGLITPRDYIQDTTGCVFLNSTVLAGDYHSFQVMQYFRLTLSSSKDELCARHPILKKWLQECWPCSIGRYRPIGFHVVDVVYGHESPPHDGGGEKEHKSFRYTPIDHNWSTREREEWLRGTHGYIEGWSYDLRSAVLASVIMDYVNEIPQTERTPHRIVRHLLASADVCNREDALLHGKWQGSYSDGVRPTEWHSNLAIYAQRAATGKPVKYAQCWVYAEVLTAAFRFLGMAARTVHAVGARIDRHRDGGIDLGFTMSKGDGGEVIQHIAIDVSTLLEAPTGIVYEAPSPSPRGEGTLPGEVALLRIDSPELPLPPTELKRIPSELVCVSKGTTSPRAYRLEAFADDKCLPPTTTEDMKKLVGTEDSTWNFHVWNEVYLERPDLKEPYNRAAWQCLDASPIVPTDSADTYAGKHIFGPCSTLALKDGVDQPHDFRFLYSAVNGVHRYWRTTNDICYVTSIIFASTLASGNTEEKPVVVTTRDPHSAIGFIRDITAGYTPANVRQAYDIHHAHHPCLFTLNEKKLVIALERLDGQYYVQICLLGEKDQLLQCIRQQVTTLKALILPKLASEVRKVSLLTVDTKTQKWWVQLLECKLFTP